MIVIGFTILICLVVVIVTVNISHSKRNTDVDDIETMSIAQTDTVEEERSNTENDSTENVSPVTEDISNNTTENITTEDTDSGEVARIAEGGSLVIPISEITTNASFYPVEVDGTELEIIAVKDSDGYIRTAFNTCQICYDSGRGYYEQEGAYLVCQNCGNRFTMDDVETKSGGCNPWPIFAENKIINDDTIEISYDFLKESKEIFANWKYTY